MTDDHPKNSGCNLYHDCLTCPLPRCQYDLAIRFSRPHSTGHLPDFEKNKQILELTASGHSRQQIAAVTGVSIRHISRVRNGK